jgi:hypothetical protein
MLELEARQMLTWIINWLNKVDIDFQVTTIVLRTSWFTGVESSSNYYEPGAETALTLNNRGFYMKPSRSIQQLDYYSDT